MATIGMIANTSTQSFVWGRLLDKYHNAKNFIVVGEFIAGLFHIAMVLSYQQFLKSNKTLAGFIIIITLGLTEVFWSMSNVGWSALIANLTVSSERKKIIARLSVIGGIGGIFGAQVGGILYQNGAGFDSGIILYIAAFVMIISSFVVYFIIHERKNSKPISSDGKNVQKASSKFSELPTGIKKTFIWFMIALTIINFGRNSIAVLTGIFLADPSAFGAGGEAIAIFSNISSIATIIVGILIGTIIAMMDDNKVLLTGAFSALIAILWLIATPTFLLSLVSGFLIGASNVIIESSSYAIVSTIIPEEFRGRLFGIYNATFYLSYGIAATTITGPTADYMISRGLSDAQAYRISFLVAALITAIGIIILFYSFKLINSLKAETNASQVEM